MLQRIGKVASLVGMGKMSAGEYKANLNGINMFFGAVLGVVLAGMEKLDSLQFGFALMIMAGNVTSIMFITGSRHRVMYAIFTLTTAFMTPVILETVLRSKDAVPNKLLPTLLAWALMTILVEFWGREQAAPVQAEEEA